MVVTEHGILWQSELNITIPVTELDSAGLMVGLDDLEGLLQPKCFCDSGLGF